MVWRAAKYFYFSPEMFTKLPKSDVLLRIFVKMTQKIQVLLYILHKSASHTPLPAHMLFATCLQVIVCGYKTGRGWVHAVVCDNKTGRGCLHKLKTLSI